MQLIEKQRKPSWLRVKLPTGEEYKKVREIVSEHKLHTICESGNCPNMGECWGAGTATFMILGNVCTRSCTFCAVATGRPPEYDAEEPKRVAEAIKLMGVKHAVITSVNRDELKDRGAEIWYQTVHIRVDGSLFQMVSGNLAIFYTCLSTAFDGHSVNAIVHIVFPGVDHFNRLSDLVGYFCCFKHKITKKPSAKAPTHTGHLQVDFLWVAL